jgi:hypothetical protein
MAELRRVDGTRSCLLMNDHLIGRGTQCALQLTAGYVSTQHALIRWAGHAWELLDRGSRNGTQLDGASIEPGRAYRLAQDSVVTFGHADERWVLSDASEPETMAIALDTGEVLLGGQGLIGLPSSKDPEATLYLDRDGAWKLEQADGEVVPVLDGQLLEVAGRRFRFSSPSSNYATENLAALHSPPPEPTLHFLVSSDEDFVELTLEYPDRRIALGSRAHNYLMLTLARSRLADLAADLPPGSCGWMDKDQIAEGLKVTPQQVDGEVFRIRRHFSQHGLPEAAIIIERRPRTKQIRLGVKSLRIERG